MDVETAQGQGPACSCCGQRRRDVVSLRCHAEVKVCRGCIGWLRDESGALDVTPTLPVHDMAGAISVYEAAGFDARKYDGGDGFAFVTYEDESVFDLALVDELDPSTNAAGCYMIVPDVDEWHSRLTAAALSVTEPADQPWGIREFTLRDPSNNCIRIGQRTDT